MRNYIKCFIGAVMLVTTVPAFAAVVVNTADSGAGSLRQAILDANGSGGTITFSGVSGTINLSSALPKLSRTINIVGPGAAQLTVKAVDYSIFTNALGNSAALSGLTLTSRGALDVNALANLGSLVVSNCIITNCNAVSGNTAGIYNSGTLNATNCLFSGNSGWSAGAIYNTGTLHLAFCTFTNSTGPQVLGRSIYNGNAGNLSADYCVIGGNWGGLYNAGGTMVLRNCAVTNNSTFYGGGIFNAAQLAITNCTISHNRAFYSSGPEPGGGLYNSGSATLVNATVSGNSALGAGGGILNLGTLLLVNSTVVSNSAQDQTSPFPANGGGVCNSNTFQSKNSIFAWNTTDARGPDIYGNFNSLGYNLVQSASGWVNVGVATGNLVGADPKLGPLQDNGGPTQTHALLPNSPAINAGDAVGAPTTDQRGVLRPQGLGVDIGAYEFQFCVPIFVRAAIQNRTNLWLQACGLPCRTYTLQAPEYVGWVNIATLTTGADGLMQFTEHGYLSYPARFYRLQGTSP
jgi:hypothetical protein